ncbi:phytoene/squalene synthase family protein [Planococcus shenhongbingii]|uniref:Phytoene/squalene synthase family protein n=1 Tax=Planococcus shenhongbingii TaxID=3058398 RepID=A0ABT8NFP0_9BACL|nr:MULTISPECIES: phytoene/squalene synthase family protein [unclassified Planococcus (in: firmicutes)]MDN7246305.1 phytoene/squalene synthase family protein [Planococcus sp. N017]WKA59311.1 phytoene/squalene synthase family protein [Planococcus sp. N016]
MTAQMSVPDDFAFCEQIIKRHSKSFYYAFSKLPEEKAQAVYALYAFCRTADDSVDENLGSAAQLAALDKLTDELDRFAGKQEINHPLWRALRVVFNKYEMDLEPFYDQIKGQRMDISFSAPKTLEDVETYSYYVAGSVGRMLLPIIASNSKVDCTDSAVSLGVAMQLTNILRDVGEDYRGKRRIYLPTEELKRAGYRVEQLANAEITGSFIEVWEGMAKRAEDLYDEFLECVSNFDEDSRFPVLVSAQVYRGILGSVRQNNYDCFARKNYVTKREMVRILSDSII